MKPTVKTNLKLTTLFFLFALVVITSCKDDDPVPAEATIEVTSDQLIDGVYRGVLGATDQKGKLTLHLAGDVPAGIKSLQIRRTNINDGVTHSDIVAEFDALEGDKEFDIEFIYNVQVTDIDAESMLTADLIDKRDRGMTTDLASVKAYWPLDSSPKLFLDSDMEPGVGEFTYFLTIASAGTDLSGKPKIDPQTTGRVDLAANGQYNNVHLIFDYDLTLKGGEPVGSFLCSPHYATTSNNELVESFSVKHNTLIKIIPYNSLTAEEVNQLNNIGPNDTALLVNLFDKYQPGSTNERATFNGAQGNAAFVLFKTHNGKIGLIKNYDLSEQFEATLEFDLWMML